MKAAEMDSRKKTQRAGRVAPTESLRLKPRYGLVADGAGDPQEIGGGTPSPMLRESRLYTAGRSLRS
jgi:hypothetical protein